MKDHWVGRVGDDAIGRPLLSILYCHRSYASSGLRPALQSANPVDRVETNLSGARLKIPHTTLRVRGRCVCATHASSWRAAEKEAIFDG